MDRCVKSLTDLRKLRAIEESNGNYVITLGRGDEIEIYHPYGNQITLVGTAHVFSPDESNECIKCKKLNRHPYQ